MRPRVASLLIALLQGCGGAPGPARLTPTRGTALGGETVCVTADELSQGDRVAFGGAPATGARLTDGGALCVTSPRGLAGAVDVVVDRKGGEAVVFDRGFTYTALELTFQPVAAHYLPAPPVDLSAGVAVDVDADGLDDLVVADAAGGLSVWRATGDGGLEGAPVRGLTAPVRDLAVLAGAEGPLVVACVAGGEATRLFAARDGALSEVAGGVPAEVGTCRGLSMADLDGDGVDEVLEARDDGLRVWAQAARGLAPWAGGPALEAEDCGALVGSAADATICAVSGDEASLFAESDGRLGLRLTPPPGLREAAGLSLVASGDLHEVAVRDAEGERFTWYTDGAAGAVEVPPVAEWTPDTEGALPVLPLTQLTLISDGALTGGVMALQVSSVDAVFDDGGVAALGRWAAVPLDAAGALTAAAALDADADGVLEVVTGGAEGPALWVQAADGLAPAAFGALPAAPACVVGALLPVDLDPDGQDELLVACDGQDLLYRGDGAGRFFEDGAATLPIDAAAGTAAAAADLDLDGIPELLVASEGSVDRLYHSDGGAYADWSGRLDLLPGPGRGLHALDLDGDGDLDLVSLQGDGEPSRLYHRVEPAE